MPSEYPQKGDVPVEIKNKIAKISEEIKNDKTIRAGAHQLNPVANPLWAITWDTKPH